MYYLYSTENFKLTDLKLYSYVFWKPSHQMYLSDSCFIWSLWNLYSPSNPCPKTFHIIATPPENTLQKAKSHFQELHFKGDSNFWSNSFQATSLVGLWKFIQPNPSFLVLCLYKDRLFLSPLLSNGDPLARQHTTSTAVKLRWHVLVTRYLQHGHHDTGYFSSCIRKQVPKDDLTINMGLPFIHSSFIHSFYKDQHKFTALWTQC